MASINRVKYDKALHAFTKRIQDATKDTHPEGIKPMAATTPWACYMLKSEFVAEGIALCALAAAGVAAAGIAAAIGTGVVAIANVVGYTLTVEEFTTAFVNDVGGNVSMNPWNAAGQLANVICKACGGDAPCCDDGSAG